MVQRNKPTMMMVMMMMMMQVIYCRLTGCCWKEMTSK